MMRVNVPCYTLSLTDKEREAVVEALMDRREQFKALSQIESYFEWMDKADAVTMALEALGAN